MATREFYEEVDDYLISVLKTTQANTVRAQGDEWVLNRNDRHEFYTEVRERIEDIIMAMERNEI